MDYWYLTTVEENDRRIMQKVTHTENNIGISYVKSDLYRTRDRTFRRGTFRRGTLRRGTLRRKDSSL